ncbi:MAG: glutaminyl-peptide cyclotransferase, partial [Litorimonas sp.]
NSNTLPTYGYKVVASYPHDDNAFTQGLFYEDGYLYESTGFWKKSSIRKVELNTGKVIKQQNLRDDLFGEGLVRVGNFLVNVTWKSQIALIFDYETFELKSYARYEGEGWGLTTDGEYIYMSDGTPEIRVLSRTDLSEIRRIAITANGEPVEKLNELEWINGEIYANIWETNRIARIDPATGAVIAWIDLTGLLENHGTVTDDTSDLNGIAYDKAANRLFVTGKYWTHLFEIDLIPPAEKK